MTVSTSISSALDPAATIGEASRTQGAARAAPAGCGSSAGAGVTCVPSDDDGFAALRGRLVVSALLAAPVVALGMIPVLQFDYWQWLSLTLAAPIAVWGAAPFHRAAWDNLRGGVATADTLVSIGTFTALGWSLYTMFLGDAGMVEMRHGLSFTPEPGMAHSQMYLEVAATVPVFVLAGRYAEAWAARRYGTGCAPAGTAIPGAPVARVQRLVDRVAAVFVPVVIVLAAAAFGFWLSAGNLGAAFAAGVAVLVIGCPCALSVAAPTAFTMGAGKGPQLGVAVEDPGVVEQARWVDTLVVAKGGVLSTGHSTVVDVVTAEGTTTDEVLSLAATLAIGSGDRTSRAVVAAAEARGLSRAPIEIIVVEGLGTWGVVNRRVVVAGRTPFFTDWALHVPPALSGVVADAEAAGRRGVLVAWDGIVRAVLVVADTIRPTAPQAVAALHALGLEMVLVTLDDASAAADVAAQVGIDRVVAATSVGGSAGVVAALQDEGRVVAVLADPDDDAAFVRADLRLAVSVDPPPAAGGVDLSLTGSDLWVAVDGLRLCRAVRRNAKANLFWALGYNVAVLPVAAAGLLNPMLAGAAMTLSTVFILANSLRLRRFRTARPPAHRSRLPRRMVDGLSAYPDGQEPASPEAYGESGVLLRGL